MTKQPNILVTKTTLTVEAITHDRATVLAVGTKLIDTRNDLVYMIARTPGDRNLAFLVNIRYGTSMNSNTVPIINGAVSIKDVKELLNDTYAKHFVIADTFNASAVGSITIDKLN